MILLNCFTYPSSVSAATGKRVTRSAEFIKRYWTPDRMEHATPAGIPSKTGAPPHMIEPAPVKAQEVPPASYSSIPYAVIGKVFFTDSKTGFDYVCSGTAVISKNKSTVDTAGHCVAQDGSKDNYYTNWMFCPQYLDGDCPKGKWAARQLFADKTWLTASPMAVDHDYGAAVVEANNGQYLTDVVGGVAFGANLDRKQTFHALGYPHASPFNGKKMFECLADKAVDDTGTPPPLGISCDLTGGSSGGGWLVQSNGTWYVNGHNDYQYTNDPNTMYSPYYGNEALAIYNSAQAA
jgi:hypothetical protein